MIDWVTDTIAVSEYPSSKTDLNQFDAILNLDRFTPYHHQEVEHVHIPIIDGPGNEPQEIVAVLERMDGLLRKGRVLVHCAAGVSRSPFIIALYLAWKQPLTFDEAMEIVARQRSRPLNVDDGLLALSGEILGRIETAGAAS